MTIRAADTHRGEGGDVSGSGGEAEDVDQLVAKGHRPAGAVGGDRPGPARTAFDVGDSVEMPVVDDNVTGLDFVSVDRCHRLASFRCRLLAELFVPSRLFGRLDDTIWF
jgi:hypothetical protein